MAKPSHAARPGVLNPRELVSIPRSDEGPGVGTYLARLPDNMGPVLQYLHARRCAQSCESSKKIKGPKNQKNSNGSIRVRSSKAFERGSIPTYMRKEYTRTSLFIELHHQTHLRAGP